MSRPRAVVALLLLLVFAGCGRRESHDERDGVPTPSPVAVEPPGARVGANDPVVVAMRPHLGEWVRLWAHVIPGFTLDSLYRSASEPLGYAYSRAIAGEDLARARRFGALAPDSTRIAEPNLYWMIANGEPEFEAEPDAASALLDLRRDSLHVLATVGTAGRFDGTFWIDRRRFVVIGRGERVQEPERHGGDLWVYDLGAGTLTRYHTPDVDAAAYARLSERVNQWLRRRYARPPA